MSLICSLCTRPRLLRCGGILGMVAIVALTGVAAASPAPQPRKCPKILMFGGLDIHTQNNETMAQYWGQKIGVQGFFVLYVMGVWDDSVGDDESSLLYQQVKGFQELYSKYGVTDNFLEVALYTAHDWRTPAAQTKVVSNFRQAAHLARYAGLKGLALDIEAYVPTWNEDPAIPDKATQVFRLGRRIGGAILSEFPDATVIVLPEILTVTCPPSDPVTCKAYALSSRFWDGLIQARFNQLLIATEATYDANAPNLIASQVQSKYQSNLLGNGLSPDTVPIAVGIWPLAQTFTDKSARISPAQFEERLKLALQVPSPYIWIYGHGSAWQKFGPYGKGDVDPHFDEYVQVLHRVKKSCSSDGAIPQH